MQQGVVWITGLPGAGKTTLSRALVSALQVKGITPVLLDGDQLRRILNNTAVDTQSRAALAMSYATLAQHIAAQGHIVIVATVSMFDDVRAWSRSQTTAYYEVFLDIPLAVLRSRDQKGLYSSHNPDLPGITSDAQLPTMPDCIPTTKQLADLPTFSAILADNILSS